MKEQVTEIHGKPHSFPGIQGAGALIDGSLCPETYGVVAMDAQYRRAEEDLVGLRLRDREAPLDKAVGMLSSKTPFQWFSNTPQHRSIGLYLL